MINYNLGAKLADVADRLETIETKPKPYDLYYAVKNPGDGTGWSYHCAGLGVQTIRDAATLIANFPVSISEGAFRMGARAMQQAVLDHYADVIAQRGNRAPVTTEIIKATARIAGDVPLPPFPAQPVTAAADWQWWSGTDDEYFTNGPYGAREHAVEELDGEGGYIVEAVRHAVHFSADDLITHQYFENDALFSGEHGDPDRKGGADVIAAADAELQALLDGWLARWGHTFVEPEMFARTRNAEHVPADPCPACQDIDCDGPLEVAK